MDLRSGNSASRRRRVLREDVTAADGEVAAPRRKTRVRIDAAHYPEAALPHRQPRLADLLPAKWWSVGLTAGAGAVVATSVLIGFAYRASLAGFLGEEALRPLDLTIRGNLADWLASWTLLTAALVAGIVYSLRRHRTDDYRGRYRAWLWITAALFLGAMDAACGFHQSLSGGVVALTGITVCGQGAFWWLLVEGLILLAVSVAMLREYLRCRTSLATLSLTLLAYAGLAAATVYRLDVIGSTTAWLVQESFRLFSHLLLTLSVLLYARHVLRDVQGMGKAVRRKRKSKADAAEEEESRVPAPHFRPKADAPKPEAAKPKASGSTSSSTTVAAKAPTPPPAPVKSEPPRTQNAPVTSKPTSPATDARTSDSKPASAPSGEVRRTDPPSKNAGPLAGKLRPSNAPATVSAPSRPSADDDEEDDDRNSRKNKKRGR